MREERVGYLHDCINKSKESELFIVYSIDICDVLRKERDRFRQAVLFLGEDIAEVEGAEIDVALDNESLKGLVSSLGVGIDLSAFGMAAGNLTCDLSKLRYGRLTVVIDGSDDGVRFEKAVFRALKTYFGSLEEVASISSIVYSQSPNSLKSEA